MKSLEQDKGYNIYIAEYIYTSEPNGCAYKNYTSLEKVPGRYPNFTEDAWPKIAAIKKNLVNAGATQSCLSRSKDWCVDLLARPATAMDTERDYMFPELIHIEIITTPYELKLTEQNQR